MSFGSHKFFTITNKKSTGALENILNTEWFMKLRIFWLTITQYAIPLILITILYALVMYRIWLRVNISGTIFEHKKRKFEQKKRRTIMMLITITVLFALNNLPTYLYLILEYFNPKLFSKPDLSQKQANRCSASIMFFFFYWISMHSCSMNPFNGKSNPSIVIIIMIFDEIFTTIGIKFYVTLHIHQSIIIE